MYLLVLIFTIVLFILITFLHSLRLITLLFIYIHIHIHTHTKVHRSLSLDIIIYYSASNKFRSLWNLHILNRVAFSNGSLHIFSYPLFIWVLKLKVLSILFYPCFLENNCPVNCYFQGVYYIFHIRRFNCIKWHK